MLATTKVKENLSLAPLLTSRILWRGLVHALSLSLSLAQAAAFRRNNHRDGEGEGKEGSLELWGVAGD